MTTQKTPTWADIEIKIPSTLDDVRVIPAPPPKLVSSPTIVSGVDCSLDELRAGERVEVTFERVTGAPYKRWGTVARNARYGTHIVIDAIDDAERSRRETGDW